MSPRILLIHTGGTLGMAPSGEPSALAPGPSLEAVLEQVPELRQLSDLKLEVPFNRDSASMEPSHVLSLATLIRERSQDCQGVVLIHGTDTMAFTASILGFLLSDLGKPVVITGAQRPLAYIRSDARGNLVDAFELAMSGVPEVGICFGKHWLRGVGAEKASVHRFEAFVSPNLQPLADLGTAVRIHSHAGAFERHLPKGLGKAFESRILVHTPFPGMHWPLPAPDTRAVLIQAYGAGNLPVDRPDLQALFTHCRAKGLPVVLTSQCLSGGVDLNAYELGRYAGTQGVISGGLHTRWAALAKLGLTLGAGWSTEAIREAFHTSWAGEPV